MNHADTVLAIELHMVTGLRIIASEKVNPAERCLLCSRLVRHSLLMDCAAAGLPSWWGDRTAGDSGGLGEDDKDSGDSGEDDDGLDW